MSNITVNFNQNNDNKIIIKDDSDDSFYSNKSVKVSDTSKKQTLFEKLGNETLFKKEVVVKTPKKNKNYKKYNSSFKNNNSKIINETKNILEKSYVNYQESNEDYYNDTLEWMNLVYNHNASSILKVKISKITLNEDIFLKYNEIIKKYKLRKDLFNLENFDINNNYDYNSILEIAKIMTKNLLEKLNYKLDIVNYGNKKKLKIKNISNQI